MSDGDAVGVDAAEFGGELSEVAVAESVGLEFEQWERCEQGVGSLLTQAQPGDPRPIGGDDGVGDGVQCIDAVDRVVADCLDAQQAPVGGEADLPQCGQICQSFPNTEIVSVIDGRFSVDIQPVSGVC